MANEKIIFDTEVKVGSSVGSVKSLKAELRAVTNELGQLEVGSEAFVKAAQKAGDLQDRIGDVKNTVAAFNPEAKFQALAGVVGIAANGFSAMQGAMALMGGESENLNRVIAQTQGAIALATGLNGLLGMKDAFDLLKLQAVTSFTAIKAAAVTTFTTIKGAMAATGIGALLVGLGYLYTKFLETAAANEEATKKEKEYAEQTKKTKEATDEKVKSIELEIIAIKNKTNAAGATLIQAKAEKLALEEQIKLADEHNKQQKEAYTTAEVGNKIITISNLIETDSLKKKLVEKNKEIESLDLIAKKTKELEDVKKSADDAEKQAAKAATEAKKKKEFKEKLIEEQKKQQADFIARTEKEYQDTNKFTDEFYKKKELALVKSGATEEEIKKEIKKGQQEIEIANLEQKIQNAKDYGQSTVDFELELENKKTNIKKEEATKQADINKKIAADETKTAEERYAALNALAASHVISEKEASDAKIAIAKAEKDARNAALQEGANVLNQAADLLGKNTAEGKALAVASATISTYLSAQKAFESFASIPVVGVGLGIAAASVAVAAGIANVNKILSTPVPGNNGGGGGGSNPTAPSAPRIPQSFSGSSLRPNSEVITKTNGQVQKVIVTETDITKTQDKVKGIIRKATIK
jgi:hypothetical protein